MERQSESMKFTLQKKNSKKVMKNMAAIDEIKQEKNDFKMF